MAMNSELIETEPFSSDVDNVRWQEWIKAAVLLGSAGYFAFNIASGNIVNYVNERFAWLSYVAVLIFAALGLTVAIGALHNQKAPRGYGHVSVTWSIIVVVAIPLFLGVFVPSKPLGAEAVNGDMSLSVASVSPAGALTKDPRSRNILDWLRVFNQSASPSPSSFDGEQADLIGFVYREPDYPADHFMVARFTMSCCVADAGAIGLPVYTANAADFTDGDWVRVQGSFQAGDFVDMTVPILLAEAVEQVEQPAQPYLYP